MRPAALAAVLILAAGCSSTAPPEEGPAAPPPPVPDRNDGKEFGIDAAPAGALGDLLAPAKTGDVVVEGVLLADPVLDADGTVASFTVRNGSGADLPDLILAVVFAMPTPDGGRRPRIETLEAPLRKGESRALRVALGARAAGERPASFRVTSGLPEMLAARSDDGRPGTTFLGGLLECARLDADLTAEVPTVRVGLEDRAGAPASLEAQLLLARSGSLVWTGSWIVVPRAAAEGDGPPLRTIRWSLPRGASVAGCTLLLRVREKR